MTMALKPSYKTCYFQDIKFFAVGLNEALEIVVEHIENKLSNLKLK